MFTDRNDTKYGNNPVIKNNGRVMMGVYSVTVSEMTVRMRGCVCGYGM